MWVALLVGTLATVIAAMVPAWKASQIPPVAALQSTQAESAQISRFARIAGVAVPAVGFGLIAMGIFGGLGLVAVLFGALVVLVGAAIALQMLARPVVTALGAPLRRFGLTGRLAGENAERNPRRAAITSGALMIGLALVSLASVFTASAKTSITETIDASYPANFAVFSGGLSSRAGGGRPSGQRSELQRGRALSEHRLGTAGRRRGGGHRHARCRPHPAPFRL